MTKLGIVLLAGAFALSAVAFAQEGQAPQGPPPGAEGGQHMRHMPSVDEMVAHMTKKLNLSQEQQSSVRTILQGQHDQMDQLMQDTSSTREAKHAKVKELHESSQTQIRAVLNDEQKKQFDEMAQEHERHMRDHAEGHGNEAPPPPPNS